MACCACSPTRSMPNCRRRAEARGGVDYSVGFNHIDAPRARRGVLVTNTPGADRIDGGFYLGVAGHGAPRRGRPYMRGGKYKGWDPLMRSAPTCPARRWASSASGASARRWPSARAVFDEDRIP